MLKIQPHLSFNIKLINELLKKHNPIYSIYLQLLCSASNKVLNAYNLGWNNLRATTIVYVVLQVASLGILYTTIWANLEYKM